MSVDGVGSSSSKHTEHKDKTEKKDNTESTNNNSSNNNNKVQKKDNPPVTDGDRFDSGPPRGTGPVNLDGGSTPPTTEITAAGGTTKITTTTPGADGSNTTDTLSTGDGKLTLGTETTQANGDKNSNSVTVGPNGTTFSSSNTQGGVTDTGSLTVGPDGKTTVAGSRSNDSGGLNGSVTVGPDGVSVTGGGNLKLAKGLNIKIGITASQTKKVESQDGYTTITKEGTLSVDLGGEVDLKKVSFGANHTEGEKTTYQIKMKDEDYARMQAGEIPEPNPYDPDTMPEGSAILMKSSDFESTGFKAGYDALKTECNVKQEDGVSVAIEKTGPNTVRVTAGPTEAIENSFKVGLGIGPVSANVGNTTKLDTFTAKTVEFDLSTPEGRGAYNNFMATGELPEPDAPGTSNYATIEKLNYNSTSSAGIALGPLTGKVDFASSNMNVVRTTYPDGSYDQVTDVKLHAGTPVHLEQHFNPDGTEDLSKQKISMFLVGASGGTEEEFASAYGVNQHDFDGKMDINLSFDANQAMGLRDRARDYIAQWEQETGQTWDPENQLQDAKFIDQLAHAENPTEVARALVDAYGGPAWMGAAFQSMAIVGDHLEPLPGTIEAKHR